MHMNKLGRPSDYSDEMATNICALIIEGYTLRQIEAKEGFPSKTTICRWLASNTEFRDQYARAREHQAECMADDILDISDDGSNDWIERENSDGTTCESINHEHISRSKLRVDSRKWLMSKFAPKKYGDRVTNEHTGAGGGPIKTETTLDDLSVARRIAFLLAKGANTTED